MHIDTSRILQSVGRSYPGPRHERGITLVVSLLFLLLLTIMGVTSMTTGTLQEKMAGNMRDMDIGLQSAEASLRYGEELFAQSFSASTEAPQPLSGLNNLWPRDAVTPTDTDNLAWWTANGIPYMNDGSNQISEAYEDPRHVTQEIDEKLTETANPNAKQRTLYYRVTARGVGGTGMSETILQSHYRVKW